MLAGLLVFAVVLRVGVLWAMRENLNADPDAYREIAENVLGHGTYGLGKDGMPTPTAYRPPLYPLLLSTLPATDGRHVSVWKVALLHILLGMGTVWLTYLTARRLLGSAARPGPTVLAPPTIAGLLVACDPILLNQQTLVMTETPATFLAALAVWCLVRFHDHRYWWNAGLAGGAIGLAVLCRPTFLPWLGLVALAMLMSDRKTPGVGRHLPAAVAVAIAAAGVMSPWPIRNQRQFGEPMLTTTHGGYTLWLGNNASFFAWRRSGSDRLWHPRQDRAQESSIAAMRNSLLLGLRENSDKASRPMEMIEDRFRYDLAMKAIRADPGAFALACLYRVRQLWSPLPYKLTEVESPPRGLLRYLTAAWYCGVYLLAAVAVGRLGGRLLASPWIWGVLLCLAFTAVHTLYWSNLRMRAPLMPFVAVVAAAAMISRRPDGADPESIRIAA